MGRAWEGARRKRGGKKVMKEVLNVPFPAGVVQLMRNPPSRILLFGVWIWEGEKWLFISNTLIPLIPVGSWLGFPPAERRCERLPRLFVQKCQRVADPMTGCGVRTTGLRALTLM